MPTTIKGEESAKKIYDEVIEHLNDVAVRDRFHYELFMNTNTWNQFTKEQQKELIDLMRTECNGKVQHNKFLDEGKAYLVNTRLFSPDMYDFPLE